MRNITDEMLSEYGEYLISEEKSRATVKKYLCDIGAFGKWLHSVPLTKNAVISYKEYLSSKYAPASVNSVLSSLNGFFKYKEWHDLCVKNIKIQRQIFISEEKELTKGEYARLLQTARKRKNDRLCLLMQTICSVGIRISELRYITAEAVAGGCARINCKGKCRMVFLPEVLCRMLKSYIKARKIKSGPVFVTKNGNPLDRSNVWAEMKKLCFEAGVASGKVFPHNLRHLFARTYYNATGDIVRLADVLGHSSINTTRIYTMESGSVHKKQMRRLGLLLCG